MRRFLRNIILFALPFALGLVWLFAGSYNKEYGYNMVTKDCRTGNWIYRRLYESPHPVDIAFLGTSKTMCDVHDGVLQNRLAEEKEIEVEVANFGVCRKGENLHYLIARDLFAQKPPKYLFVEVSTHLATNSHFHFPYLAESGDVLAPTMILNQDYISDIGDFAWNRLVYNRENLLGIRREFNDFLHDPQHSFMAVDSDIVADPVKMARKAESRSKNLAEGIPEGIGGWWYDMTTNYPKQYYKRVFELAQKHETEIYFLYLPVYGASGIPPRELDFYTEMGEVLTPPDSVFSNPTWHMDDSHLNQAGAAKFSDWLTQTVGNILNAELPPQDLVE